jgi:multiple sugar transport system permease protein
MVHSADFVFQASKRQAISKATISLVIALALLAYVLPYAYLVSTSFKSSGLVLAVPPTLLPKVFSTANYATIANYPGVTQAFLNSFAIATTTTILTLALAVPAAYAVTWFGTWAGRVFLMVALMMRMIPAVSIGIPLFLILVRLGLYDTWLGVALAHTTIGLPLCVWLLAGFFEAVPREIEEAARVDGCTRLGALVRIIVPVMSGGIAVTAIFAFLSSWNEFLFALLLTSVNAQTVPVIIASLNTQYGVNWGAMTALSVVYSLPAVLFAVFMQRHVISGMTIGAVKG